MGAGLARIRPANRGEHELAAKNEPTTILNRGDSKGPGAGGAKPKPFKNKMRQPKGSDKRQDGETAREATATWVKSRAVLNSGSLLDMYEDLDRTIGHGTTGLVKLYRSKKTNEEVAVKFIRKENFDSVGSESADIELVNHEIQVLMRCQGHPGLIQLLDVFETSSNVIIVMEFACGGELFRRLMKSGFCNEQDACEILVQVAEALSFLHANDVVHRDVKPQNILLTDEQGLNIKLADFGLSKVMKSNKALKLLADDAEGEHEKVMKTACGTLLYAAPEVIQRKSYDSSVDLWALGVLLFNVLSGEMPFDTVDALLALDFGSKFEAAVWGFVSQEAKDLIHGLLQKSPEKRLTCKQVLEHPWIAHIRASNATPIPTSVLDLIEKQISRNVKIEVNQAIYHSAQTDILWQIFRSIEDEESTLPGSEPGKINVERLRTMLCESGYTNMEVLPTAKIVVNQDGQNVKTHLDTVAANEYAFFVSKYLQDLTARTGRRREGISLNVAPQLVEQEQQEQANGEKGLPFKSKQIPGKETRNSASSRVLSLNIASGLMAPTSPTSAQNSTSGLCFSLGTSLSRTTNQLS